MEARGVITGLTRGAGRAHIVRAALESIAYQSRDVLEAMHADTGVALTELRVDGGASNNDFLMQFQANQLGIPIRRAEHAEMTAWGAALLAGRVFDFWDEGVLPEHPEALKTEQIQPNADRAAADTLYKGWQDAVEKARVK